MSVFQAQEKMLATMDKEQTKRIQAQIQEFNRLTSGLKDLRDLDNLNQKLNLLNPEWAVRVLATLEAQLQRLTTEQKKLALELPSSELIQQWQRSLKNAISQTKELTEANNSLTKQIQQLISVNAELQVAVNSQKEQIEQLTTANQSLTEANNSLTDMLNNA